MTNSSYNEHFIMLGGVKIVHLSLWEYMQHLHLAFSLFSPLTQIQQCLKPLNYEFFQCSV